ncbi:beta-glucosidase family protein [Paenibacillus sp. LPE1-1-1.1]|uniref:beta-glucosidase family protein n=1 Tax=Paenibacillus sp. LPE1-1-1.1 TaxID=3135230 RepID=UPI003447006C
MTSSNVHEDIQGMVAQMTLEEKASLCSGLDFWHTKGIERLGIPSLMVTDGPHGLRKQMEGADHLGLHSSVPATCFPSAAGMAASWNRELIVRIGEALGKECQAENVALLLGPGANIKRSPLCGRNFEYFSEDPYLSSELAASHISGVQSQGVGTSLKHFAANNQEHRRMTVDAVVDERTLREIYLASFEGAVKQSKPWSVMCSYNKVNGEFASENEWLLTEVLRKEWGFEGFVISDWFAVNERVKGLLAGLELEMPTSHGVGDSKIVQAIRNGQLSEDTLNRAVERLLDFIFKAVRNRQKDASFDAEAHHRLAREAAQECMVLLKNEDRILPLQKQGTIAVIGEFAEKPRYQGGGSSHVNPTKLDEALKELIDAAGDGVRIEYARGYKLDSDEVDSALEQEAKNAAAQAGVAVLFVGLPERYESESYDRTHLAIPANQRALIDAVAEVQSNLVVVLSNGSTVEMPWLDKTKAVLEGYLGGQAFGGAVADLLFGRVSPSGKLAETFPVKLSDNPSFLNFPGEGDKVEYREGLFVGYRYYDAKELEPLFPFGFGLSYTQFAYSDLRVDRTSMKDSETLNVQVTVTNTGKITGKEIVQLYVRDVVSTVIRPLKELKGFKKVELQPGEKKTVEFVLDRRAFSYYNTELGDWHVESGAFDILIGASSRQIVLQTAVKVEGSTALPVRYHRNTMIGDLLDNPQAAEMAKFCMDKFAEFGIVDQLSDNPDMLNAIIRYFPIRCLVALGQGAYTEEMLAEDLAKLNELETAVIK